MGWYWVLFCNFFKMLLFEVFWFVFFFNFLIIVSKDMLMFVFICLFDNFCLSFGSVIKVELFWLKLVKLFEEFLSGDIILEYVVNVLFICFCLVFGFKRFIFS